MNQLWYFRIQLTEKPKNMLRRCLAAVTFIDWMQRTVDGTDKTWIEQQLLSSCCSVAVQSLTFSCYFHSLYFFNSKPQEYDDYWVARGKDHIQNFSSESRRCLSRCARLTFGMSFLRDLESRLSFKWLWKTMGSSFTCVTQHVHGCCLPSSLSLLLCRLWSVTLDFSLMMFRFESREDLRDSFSYQSICSSDTVFLFWFCLDSYSNNRCTQTDVVDDDADSSTVYVWVHTQSREDKNDNDEKTSTLSEP